MRAERQKHTEGFPYLAGKAEKINFRNTAGADTEHLLPRLGS